MNCPACGSRCSARRRGSAGRSRSSLGEAGADVIVHGRRSREAAEKVAETIRQGGSRSAVLMADLGDRSEGDRLVEAAWSLWDGLDAWLHLAGADTLTGPDSKSPFDEKLDKLWNVDVVASIRLCRAVGRRMKERGRGSIVTMGWDQAETGMEGDSGELFAATKGAVIAFTRSLAPQPRARGPRQCRLPRLDQDRVGRVGPEALAGASSPRDPAGPLGSAGGGSRGLPVPGRARPQASSPGRSCGSTAARSGERRAGTHPVRDRPAGRIRPPEGARRPRPSGRFSGRGRRLADLRGRAHDPEMGRPTSRSP